MGELRFSTFTALENLKKQLWREYDHDLPTLIVCIWDGEHAATAISLFKSLEDAVLRKQANIRVELREIDGHDLEDQAPIVMLLPTYQLRTHVRPEETDLIVDELIAGVQSASDFFPNSPEGEEHKEPAGQPIPSEDPAPVKTLDEKDPPTTFRNTLLGAYLVASRKAANLFKRCPQAPVKKAEKSQVALMLERTRKLILSKYDPEQPMVMICAWEGQCAVEAVSLYEAFRTALDKYHSNATVNIKKIDPSGFADQGPLVMTRPVEAVYVKVKDYDAEMIVSRTIMRGEVLEGLLYHPPIVEEPKTLTLAELQEMAGCNPELDRIFGESDETDTKGSLLELPKSLPLLVPGKTILRSRAAVISTLQPFLRFFEQESVESLVLQTVERKDDGKGDVIIEPDDLKQSEYPLEEAELITVSDLMNEVNKPEPDQMEKSDEALQDYFDRPIIAVLCAGDADPQDAERLAVLLTSAVNSESADVRVIRPGRKTAPGLGISLLLIPSGLMYANVRPEELDWILEKTLRQGEVLMDKLVVNPQSELKIFRESDLPFYRHQTTLLTNLDHFVEDYDLDAMFTVDGLDGLRAALSQSPVSLIREVKAANFRDRFAGGMPFGFLLDNCRKQNDSDKSIVAIADCAHGSNPVDMLLLSRYLLRVVEGMEIAGYTIGCKKGVIYLRNGTDRIYEFVTTAIEELRRRHVLGTDLLDQTLSFDLEVFRSDGEDIGGEVTAVLAKIAGEVPLPKRQPPYPVESGLQGKPTIVSGLETFALLPLVFSYGNETFAEAGSLSGGGSLLVPVKGVPGHPGIVEVSSTARLESILSAWKAIPAPDKDRLIRNGQRGKIISADHLNYAYEYAFPISREVQSANGLIVTTEETVLGEVVAELESAVKASCDRCATSRVGIPQLISLLAKQPPIEERVLALAEGIRDGAACSHCRDAMTAIISLVEAAPSLFTSAPPYINRKISAVPGLMETQSAVFDQNFADRRNP